MSVPEEPETRISIYRAMLSSGAHPKDAFLDSERVFGLICKDTEDILRTKLSAIRQLDMLVSKGKSCTYSDKRTGVLKEKFRYVSFEEIIKAYSSVLDKHGIALDFFSDYELVGCKIIVRVQARASLAKRPVAYVTSGNFSGVVSYTTDTQPAQSEFVQYQKPELFSDTVKNYGSLLSYLKRYALIYLLCVKTTEARDIEQVPDAQMQPSNRLRAAFDTMPDDKKKSFQKKYKCTDSKIDSFLAVIEATDPKLTEYIFSFDSEDKK